ncbi:MAG: ral nucleoside transport system ATP-binding protein, partial [Gaiellales bacterium]|nr:ral nucleoside transport system ATP-binding protein [Gaiellales bacterium]
RSLTAEGKSIIFITHKLGEVLQMADRITVIRRGRTVDTVPAAGATQEALARLMVGREVVLRIEKTPAQPGAALLTVNQLEVTDDRDLLKVKGLSLEVRSGEIVGIAGVDGNGQTELVEAIAGLRKPGGGRITLAGTDITGRDARGALDAGLGHIPEDRQRRGLVLEFTLAENVVLHDYNREPFSRFGWLFPSWMRVRARDLLEEYDVRGGDPDTPAGALSGGNQQKVVVAREVARDPALLIAAQPTRGLDVGAIEFVHRRLVTERDSGRGILLVSLELDEILALSDRILVLYEGVIVGEYGPSVSAEELGVAMLGGTKEAVV